MNIYLVGLPGSGKSTLGRQIADSLQYTYIDLDDAIIASEGMTIEDIFKHKGENYFRELEYHVLHQTFSKKNSVISTGGGAPCYFDNMQRMNENGTTLYIKPDIDELVKRLLSQGRENRPLLKGKNDKQVKDFIVQKYNERSPFYELAKKTFSSNQLKASDILRYLKTL
ncbi:MAG: shikimate kinase [Cytophagaceae bacterium]|jgi:shikimate kinase|nr:shikimate kinase [Cytophagaceae bacterium]